MTNNSFPNVDGRRRDFLIGAGLFAACSLNGFVHPAWGQTKKALPQYANWKDAEAMIVHSPTTIETERQALARHLVTPERILYIRNNLSPPNQSIVANRDAWQVAFEGVRNPRRLRVGELKKMERRDITMVLQCSGNGRAYFPHNPSGTQWTVGAAGNVTWTGVPLKTVVSQLGGPIGGARFITGTGGEELPPGVDAKSVIVERSVPLAALEDALLAWDLNGSPVSLAHGGPVRLIIPGYTGVNNVKYVKRIALTANESDARIQASRYRMVPLGGKANRSHPSVWEMEVKSWINLPNPTAGSVPAGSVLIEGVAFGGMVPVKGVEVSADGGQTWLPAPLVGEDMGRYAWRQFVAPVRLQPGTYTLMSRATDIKGNVQPEQRPENQSGYVNNSWRDHAITIKVT
jgi:DMSO/TMAO reductase YedYZ molybdopterin-dependent catalytic subunit